MNLDPEVEKKLVEYQNMERQLQNVVLQKHQLQLQVNEMKLATDELGKTNSDDIYKSIGSLMIKTTKKDAEADLEDRIRMSEMRLNTLSKQEEKLKKDLTELRTDLEASLKGLSPEGGA